MKNDKGTREHSWGFLWKIYNQKKDKYNKFYNNRII